MRLLIYTAALAVILAAFGYRIETMQAEVRDYHERILELEVHDCGFVQFEDYSVMVQADDWQRERCVAAMRGLPDPLIP